MPDLSNNIFQVTYFIGAILFIFGLKKMRSPVTAKSGLNLAAIGILLSVLITYFEYEVQSHYLWMTIAIIIGGVIAYMISNNAKLTEIPQLATLFSGFAGGSAATIAALELIRVEALPEILKTLAVAGALIGSISFSGSLISFAKLQGYLKDPIRLPMHQWLNAFVLVIAITFGAAIVLKGDQFELTSLIIVFVLALAFGGLMTIPMGNSDMPIAISLLNALTGLAVGFEGYVVANPAIMIAGLLVAGAGLKMTLTMSKAINRPVSSLLFGEWSDADNSESSMKDGYSQLAKTQNARELQSSDAAMMMAYAKNIIIVPGYGMAAAQAQNKMWELSKQLIENGAIVKFAIHPAAGRMPGHMNILLAEAGIPYESIFDLDAINGEFASTDVVLVLGANDTINPAARSDQKTPLFGMPILNVDQAKNIIVVKRADGRGYSDINNALFDQENTGIVYGDAQFVLSKIVNDLKEI